jgi:hypothetical protein
MATHHLRIGDTCIVHGEIDFIVTVDKDGFLAVMAASPMIFRPVPASNLGGVARDAILIQSAPQAARQARGGRT